MAKAKNNKQMDKTRMIIMITVILVLVLAVVIQKLPENSFVLWTNEEAMSDQKLELRDAQSDLLEALNAREKSYITRNTFKSKVKDYWIIERDGSIEGTVQKKVENAAMSANLKLSTLGTLTNKKIDEGIDKYQLSISSIATMESVAKFMSAIHTTKPKLMWDSCSIRPKSPKGSDEVRLDAKLSFTCIKDENLINLAIEKKESTE